MAKYMHMQRFDELKTRIQVVEDPYQTVSQLKAGLRDA